MFLLTYLVFFGGMLVVLVGVLGVLVAYLDLVFWLAYFLYWDDVSMVFEL